MLIWVKNFTDFYNLARTAEERLAVIILFSSAGNHYIDKNKVNGDFEAKNDLRVAYVLLRNFADFSALVTFAEDLRSTVTLYKRLEGLLSGT